MEIVLVILFSLFMFAPVVGASVAVGIAFGSSYGWAAFAVLTALMFLWMQRG